jgi:hypothetical protein
MLNLQLWHIVLTVIVLLFLGAFLGSRVAIIRTLVQNSSRNVKTLPDKAAEAVADRPTKEWAAQIIRLLQVLEAKSSRVEYRETLETVRDAITARLMQGWW